MTRHEEPLRHLEPTQCKRGSGAFSAEAVEELPDRQALSLSSPMPVLWPLLWPDPVYGLAKAVLEYGTRGRHVPIVTSLGLDPAEREMFVLDMV